MKVFSLYCQAEAETGELASYLFFLESEQVWPLDLAIAIYIVAFGRPRFCRILVQLGR